MKNISNLIKNTRKKAGLTQIQMAKILQVSKSLVSAWESGQRKMTVEKALWFAHSFGLKETDVIFTLIDDLAYTPSDF